MTVLPRMLRALVALAVMIGASWCSTAPAAAEEPGSLVDVSITGVSAPVLDLTNPRQVVELRGTIINTSAAPISYLTIQLWRDVEPIDSRDALDEVLTSPNTSERGRLFSEENGNMTVVTREDFFAPGARHSFVLRTTVQELGLTVDDAVYELGVHVRGIPENGSKQTVGRGHVLAVATGKPIRASAAVCLTAVPSRAATGEFLDESLAAELDGRLGKLLQVAERPGVVTLLDPMLLDDAVALGKRHSLRGTSRDGLARAREWVGRVQTLIDAGRVRRLPWAAPDLARTPKDLLTQALAWGAESTASTALAAAPAAVDLGETASASLVRSAAAAGYRTTFAGNATSGRLDAAQVLQTAPLGESGPGPGARDTPAQRTGRQLAEDLLAKAPRIFLLRDPADLPAFDSVLRHHELIAPSAPAEAPEFEEPDVTPHSWDELQGRIRRAADDAGFIRELTGQDGTSVLHEVAATALSGAFSSEHEAIAYVDANQVAALGPDQVTISAARQFVMGARTNNFPVTVTNGLPVAVRVRLAFDSESPHRISVPTSEVVAVAPGESYTINVSPEASANSVVNVTARLETAAGTAFGQPVPIEIAATDLGRVGWIIIIVSGAVVLGGTFLRIRAVQAERAREHSEQSGQ